MRRLFKRIKEYSWWSIVFLIFGTKNRFVRYDNTGKKVVAVGNGPSASRFPYMEYKKAGYHFICVNFFALDEERFFSLKPRFYCCIDTYFEKEEEKIVGDQKKLVDILNRVDWDMHFVCFKNAELPIKNSHIKFDYINNCELKGEITIIKKHLYDSNMATHGYQNVIIAVLYYLVMSRVSEIVLTGVENDWHRELSVDKNNDVYRETTHFYGNKKINITEISEINKGELYKYFFYYYMTLYNYNLNAKYASMANVKIYNSCVESYIDVYEKIRAEEHIK